MPHEEICCCILDVQERNCELIMHLLNWSIVQSLMLKMIGPDKTLKTDVFGGRGRGKPKNLTSMPQGRNCVKN